MPESIAQPFAGLAQCCLQVDPALRCTLDDVNKARSEPVGPLANEAGNSDKTGTVPARFRVTALIATVVAVFAVIAALYLRSSRTSPSLRDIRQQPVTAAIATPKPATPVRVRITVDPNGDVSNATLELQLGPSRYFANLALQAAQDWKFKPAQVDGQFVRRVWILQFDFRQTGTEVTQVETYP